MRKYLNLLIIEIVCVFVFTACGFFFVSKMSALPLMGLGIVLIAIQFFDLYQRNKKLISLNDYLYRIIAGDESLELKSMEERELSVLKTNLFKTMTLLMHQRQYMKEEKVRMANAMADISHQLKTPLTSIMVMNDLLESENDEGKRREMLQTQSVQLERMNWLVQTLLKISKFDAKCVELKKEDISTRSIIERSIKPFMISMDLKGIRFVNLISDDENNTTISCDINWTAEALQNIMKNCIEHMKEGDTLTVSDEETTLYTALTISDTGCGIEEEDIDHIFERFYRGKNSSSDSVGIGLALSKTIIDEQKGEVSVKSKAGEGTTFTVKFYKTII